MAHKKGLGSSRNGRDSNAQRLGFKAFGGQIVPGGTIIVRQRGTRVKPGLNVGRGKDDTLFAKISGKIIFKDRGSMGKFVMIEPLEANSSLCAGRTVARPSFPLTARRHPRPNLCRVSWTWKIPQKNRFSLL